MLETSAAVQFRPMTTAPSATATPPVSRGGALVTGAGGGLGREIARALHRRGWAVHVTDVDAAAAQALAGELGDRTLASALDVTSEDACREAAQRTIDAFGDLLLWVNNAGIVSFGPVWAHDEARRRAILDVNTHGTMNGTLAALEPMRAAGRGHVLNIVSLAGIVAAPGEGVYSASKHAAIGFSLAALYDLRQAGFERIDVSCVCPDGIWTPMLFDTLDDPGATASYSGVLLDPLDVARTVAEIAERPRPVTVIPRWRGAQVRVFDALPRLMERLLPTALRQARWNQKRLKRKLAKTGRLP
jgi:NAD(P)-dependent dehydrogenase (short-subunit alcohol dehydrogenase family)